MWKWKMNKEVDERIQQESNRLNAKMYYLLTALTLALLIVKWYMKVPVSVYLLEIITLLLGGIYLVVSEMKKGIFLVKEKDEVLKLLHEQNLSNAMFVEFVVLVFGEVLYLLFMKSYIVWLPAYFCVWLPPALIITVASIKNGWLIWGTKKREKEGKKAFKKRVAIGALFYGIFVGWPFVFKDGVFKPEGILWILGMAASWGILFYILFVGMMKVAEKKANQKVLEEDKNIEE